jgi:hypothetical protein
MKIALTCAFIFPFAVLAENSDGWQKVSDSSEVISYKREVPGSSLVAFAGEGDVDAPIAKVIGIVVDSKHWTEWADHLEDNHVVEEISRHERIDYQHIGTPIVMKDRDFVLRLTSSYDSKSKIWTVEFHSIEHPKAPPTDYVRGTLMSSKFALKAIGPNRTHTWVEIHVDPKGSVPKWIVNLFQRGWARNTIQGIRKLIGNPEIAEIPETLGTLK